jgi:hypothetical protein
MKRTLTIILTASLLAACSPEYIEAATTAPREPHRVDAPEPEKVRPEPEIPNGYGDDPFFDRLWDKCEADDLEACEELFWESPVGSDYEAYGLRRIEELENSLSDRDVIDAVGVDFLLDLTWNDLTRQEQRDLCDGVRLLGADFAGALLAEGSDGLIRASEASSWLAQKCR